MQNFEIYYTIIDSPIEKATFSSLLEMMPSSLSSRLLRFRRWQDSHTYLLGRFLLLYGMKKNGLKFNLSELVYSQSGKPRILDSKNMNFNISHSNYTSACLLSFNSGEVGIDIEDCNYLNIEDYRPFFSTKEWEIIKTSPYKVKDFYSFWTRKEAVLKAAGTGLINELSSLEVISDTVMFQNIEWFLKKINLNHKQVCHVATQYNIDNVPANYVDVEEVISYCLSP